MALLVGCAPRLVWRIPGPDHLVQVEVRERSGRTCVSVGERQDGCFDGVAASDLAFSPDSRHVAFPAQEGGRWHVVLDGRPGATWDGVASLIFSPDGGHLAYAAFDARSWRLVLDERPAEPWDLVLAGSIVFASTGQRVAYGGVRDGQVHVVLDSVAGPACDGVEALRFSLDGKRFAYVARRGGRAAIVIDGAEQPPRDSISAFALSANGRHMAYIARDSASWYVVEDSTAHGPYDAARSLAYLAGGDILACVVRTREGEAILMGGNIGPRYTSVATLAYSRNGARWGYIARRGDSSVVVIDGAVTRVEYRASDLVISADGRRFAYMAIRGGDPFVVDESGTHPFDLLIDGSLVFTSDGHAWACLAGEPRQRRLFIAVEGYPRRRAFDWTAMARISRARKHTAPNSLDDAFVREWVAAEAEQMVTKAGQTKRP